MAILVPDAIARAHGAPRDPTSVRAIVLHSIGGPACIADAIRFSPVPVRGNDAIFWANELKAASEADAHFVIGRRGDEAAVIPVTEVAHHTVGVNDISIGIELVNRGDGSEPFGGDQISKLIELIKELRRQFPKIRIENIVRHSDIDQRTCSCGHEIYRRRQDPGANFPMDRVLRAVRLPDEGSRHLSSLPHLTGPAPDTACVTEPAL
jgi:N-acetyl-anhydromuramyl-L-alanine amidase AmpD